METAFGIGSPIFIQSTGRLNRIFAQASQTPSVAVRFREWQRSWESVHGQDPARTPSGEELFIRQTYVALLARLTARRFLAPNRTNSSAEELLEIINCDYFSRRGLANFGEGDIFSWVSLEPRWELGLEGLVVETMKGLSEALARYDFAQAAPGIMDGLYWQTVPDPAWPPPPRWLAEYIVGEELGLAKESELSLLDPTCGTGVFMSASIQTISRTMMEQGSDPFDILFGMPQLVQGMDRDPLAVALARLNYLLAMGDMVQQEHPPILVPVYLADAVQVAESYPALPRDVAVLVSTPGGEFPLPEPMIDNPMMLDWVLGRLTNYMDGAQLRLHVQSEDEAVQEVLNAYYNYLTAPKPRTPVPEALTSTQADILLETARSLVKLHIRGEGTFWLHMVQNNAAPEAFSRRRFDRLVASGLNPPFEMCSSMYLKPQGRAAMVMSGDEAEDNSVSRRLVVLEEVWPGAALLITGPEQRSRLESTGGPVSPNLSWSEAKSKVRVLAND
ncbi:MAG: hypothetical protein BZY87_08820 [SAR202 cluster bacterium Io17-Chloro-G6]|nr:MAG: hypothetical protein BZY87_08820 [SAR202 cluster bacterium Io17-Chloro-G6]